MSVCNLALFILHAKRMRNIILSSMTCLALLYLSTLSYEPHDFRGEKMMDFLYKFCLKYFSL